MRMIKVLMSGAHGYVNVDHIASLRPTQENFCDETVIRLIDGSKILSPENIDVILSKINDCRPES